MNQALDKLTPTDWFRGFSGDTWLRIAFTWKTKGLKLYETTITQNLLYQIFMVAKHHQLPAKLFEANSESITGNDIEVAIETDKGFILFPCQAKLIKQDRKYRTISHKVNSQYQIDLLLRYAKRVGGIPLYLFYNFVRDSDVTDNIELPSNSFGIKSYGCSIANGFLIKEKFQGNKRWKIPAFEDLHPKIALPFFKILDLLKGPLNEQECKNLFYNVNNIKFYSIKEIVSDDFWRDLTPAPSIGRLPSKKENYNELVDALSSDEFMPRYRIVISRDENFGKARVTYIS